jgi:hypothetical protein
MFLFTTRKRGPRTRRADWGFTDPCLTALEPRFLLAPIGYTPAQIVHAYGYNKVSFDVGGVAVPGNGKGETVALFEVGVTPGLSQDLAVFDRTFDLPDLIAWTSGSVPAATPFLRTIGFAGGDSLTGELCNRRHHILTRVLRSCMRRRVARLVESSPRFDFLFLPGDRALSRPRSTGVTEPRQTPFRFISIQSGEAFSRSELCWVRQAGRYSRTRGITGSERCSRSPEVHRRTSSG